jgi:Zn-dependent peptidase ImmA (M78 family)
MELGARPAGSLEKILEEGSVGKVLYDSFDGLPAFVSGRFGNAVLLSSTGTERVRSLSLAQALYHLLIPEAYANQDQKHSDAQMFASMLLLPAASVMAAIEPRVRNGSIPLSELVAVAQQLNVPTEALLLRLHSLHRVSQEQMEALLASAAVSEIESNLNRRNARMSSLSDCYLRLAHLAYNKGKIGLAC